MVAADACCTRAALRRPRARARLQLFYAVDHWMPCSRRPASELATWKAGGRLWGWRPAAQYLLPLLAFDALRPRRHLRLPPHPPTAAQLAGDVVGCLLLYDAIFFVAHLALHKGGRWLYRLHARHHAHVPVRASETVRLSAAEVFIDAGISVAVVNITGAHPLSRAVYNVTITYLLSELHCGRDFAFMPHNVVPFGLMGGPPAHAEHHASGRHNFAKFFTHCDKLFGLFRPAAQREHRKRM